MATHSSILAWRIPGTEEPGGMPSMGSHRIGHDWSELAAAAAAAEEKMKGSEKTCEKIIVKNEVQEAQWVPYRINPRRNMLRHILIKLTKIKFKEKNIESSNGKATNSTQGNPHKVINWFFNRNLQARRQWWNILKVMKEESLQPRLLYPARVSFLFNREIKTFTVKRNGTEFSNAKPV